MTRPRRSAPRARVRMVGWLSVGALVVLAVGGPTGPTGAYAWAPLNVQVACIGGDAARVTVSASQQETDYRVEVADNPSFVAAHEVALDAGSLATAFEIRPAGDTSAIWVRWAARPGVVSRADTACPTPTPTPARIDSRAPIVAPTPAPRPTSIGPVALVRSVTSTPARTVVGAAARPRVTPPPTDTRSMNGGRADEFAWRVALLALAALLAIALLVTPTARTRTRRR